MGVIRRAALILFAMWAGMGFLIGLTGSVISAPKYYLPVDSTAPLVYNSGLGPKNEPAVQTSGQGTTIARSDEIFTKKACVQCHRVTYYELKGGETGPDLSIAYTDVPNRFGRTLEDFLAEPEGTMGAIIPDRLDDEDKKLILELIIKAHEGMQEGKTTAFEEGAPAEIEGENSVEAELGEQSETDAEDASKQTEKL